MKTKAVAFSIMLSAALPTLSAQTAPSDARPPSASAGTRPLKVLMVGNSYSICVLNEMPAICADLGLKLDLCSLFIGGCPLSLHATNLTVTTMPYDVRWNYCGRTDAGAVTFAERLQARGGGHGGNLRDVLAADRWDVVTVQQASHESWRPDCYEPHGTKLLAAIRELAPQAKVYVQQTWSYTPLAPRLEKWGFDHETMYEMLASAYAGFAARHGLDVIRTGEAIQRFRHERPVVFEPHVVNEDDLVGLKLKSEKTDAGWKVEGDTIHLNARGVFLQGLVWTAKLFDADVTKSAYVPKCLTDKPDEVALMRRIATELKDRPMPNAAEAEIVRFDKGRLLMERYPGKRLEVADNLSGLYGGNVPDYAVGNVIRWLEIRGCDMTQALARFRPVEPPQGEPLLARKGFRLGYMLDISRDKVPTMATLKAMVDVLAAAGFNAFQLYTENTFAYRNHEPAWRDWSPVTAAEIRELDAYAWSKGLRLVPNQNSFGHLEKWFLAPEYRYLAAAPNGYAIDHPKVTSAIPRAVNPCDPRTYEFLGGLYDELLPNFAHADEINVGCDEVWDIFDAGARCAARAKEIGVPGLYMEHLLKVHDLVNARGKRMAFWAEMVLRYPEQLDKVPTDVNALQWGYGSDWETPGFSCEFAGRCHALKRRGIPFTVCPSTRSYEGGAYAFQIARGNIEIAVDSARRYDALGLLLTEWGDGGHRRPFLASLPAIVLTGLACRGEPTDDAALAAAIDRVAGCKLGAALLRWGTACRKPRTKPDLAQAREALASIDVTGAPDWVANGVKTMHHNQRVLELQYARQPIPDEMVDEFRKLWLEANRPGGLDDAIRQYMGR